jgi:hypothetical protein
MKTLVKYPSRARPALFKQTFAKYRQDDSAYFLVTIDADDETMNNPQMQRWLDEQPRTMYRIGNCKSKVEAINDGLAEMDWSLLILASDDMIPQRPDYAARIAELFGEFFPEGDGVLHLNDGRVGRRLNTLCVCDRKYFDRFGYLYRGTPGDGYVSLWCDNEFQEVSERLGRAIYCDEVVIAHDWIGDYAPADPLLRRNESYNDADARTFQRRKDAGFPS